MNLLLLAIAPVTVIIIWIYYKDRIEKEPKPFLLKNFILGATVSILLTVILSSIINTTYPLVKLNNTFETFLKALLWFQWVLLV